jgi:hypothetical protein
MPAPIIPSLFKSTGLSIHYAPCIASTATNKFGGYGDISELVEGYTHTHTATTGFDSATITIRGQWKDLEDWWFSGVGKDIQVFNPELNTVWRGFVDKVEVSVGPLSATRGPLSEIVNYAFVVYTIVLDDTVYPIVTGGKSLTVATLDVDSVAQYGQWEKVLSGGTCTQLTADQYQHTFIRENRLPITSEDLNIGSTTEVQLTLNCLGYWAWLKAYTYFSTTDGSVTITTKLEDVLDYDQNGIFSPDHSYIETNAFLASANEDDGALAESVIKANVSIGDVNDNRYSFGVWEDQIIRYRNINEQATAYEHFLATDDKIMVAEFGGGSEVAYWDIRAAEWLFTDFFEGKSPDTVDRRNDERFIFMEKVTFDIPDKISINGQRITTLAQFLAKKGMGGTY